MKILKWCLSYLFAAAVVGEIAYLSLADRPVEISVWLFPGVDKLVHALMYGGLGLAIWVGLVLQSGWKCDLGKAFYPVFVFSVTYGGLMEILQGWLTTARSCDGWDFFSDACGAAAAYGLGCWLVRWKRNRKK